MTARQTIPHLVAGLVQSRPERASVGFPLTGENGYTYGSLWRAACAFAEALGPLLADAHVMLIMPLGERLLAAHLGVLLQGGAASVFTHPSEKMQPDVYGRNLNHAISTLHPRVIVTDRTFLTQVTAVCEMVGVTIVVAQDVSAESAYEPTVWVNLAAERLAVLQYSSGSTGLQKCVGLDHQMVTGQCASYGRFIGLSREQDHICSWLPLYHDMGLFTAWLMPLTQGVRVSMIDPFQWIKRPQSLFEVISDRHGTLCWQPNFAYHLLASRLRAETMPGISLASMRGFSNCSEPVSARTMRAFANEFACLGLAPDSLWVCYAMAENAFAVTAAGGPSAESDTLQLDPVALSQNNAVPALDDQGVEVVSCGRPIEGCRVRIVDDRRTEMPEQRVGEIAVASPFTLREYVNAPKLTASAIDEDGWYYTGDLGFQQAGRLYVTGRQKDLLIVAGRNFYPHDIEAICNACDGTIPGRCVALGADDASTGTQKVVVIVETDLRSQTARARLSSLIRQRIFDALDCPVADVRLVAHQWLLKTSSGKIARSANLEKYMASAGRRGPRTAADRATLVEVAGWALAMAFGIYLYLLIFVLADSPSWNVYAGF